MHKGSWFPIGAVVLLVGGTAVVLSSQSDRRAGYVDTASGAFTITGRVGPMSLGLRSWLVLTATNPQESPMSLSSVSATLVSALDKGTRAPAPPVCADYLSPRLPHVWTNWTGARTLPAATTRGPGTDAVTVPLSFTDSGTDQDACENVTFNLSFAASAHYTRPGIPGVATSSRLRVRGRQSR